MPASGPATHTSAGAAEETGVPPGSSSDRTSAMVPAASVGARDPDLRLPRQPEGLSGKQPAADAGLEHRPAHAQRPRASDPGPVRLDVELQQPRRQSGEADPVVLGSADRPGAGLQLERGAHPACLEVDVHANEPSQCACQRDPPSE